MKNEIPMMGRRPNLVSNDKDRNRERVSTLPIGQNAEYERTDHVANEENDLHETLR